MYMGTPSVEEASNFTQVLENVMKVFGKDIMIHKFPWIFHWTVHHKKLDKIIFKIWILP